MFRPSAAFVIALLSFPSLARAADPAFPPGMVSASEADFVVEEPPVMPVFTWTGPYAGVQAGYGYGRDRAAARNTGPVGGRSVIGAVPDGIIGGGHFGYLVSMRDLPGIGSGSGGSSTGEPASGGSVLGVLPAAAVIGLEGDIDGADLHGKGFAPGAPGLESASVRSDIQGSIRARIGVAAQRVLFYGTGGLALADYKTSDAFANNAPEGFSHSRAGYTLGGGIEWAFMHGISVRAEYRYSDFGHFTDPLAINGPGAAPVVRHDSTQRLQTGLSYHFGSPASPPAAP